MKTALPKEYSPSDDEPYMCTRQQAFYRQRLEDWHADIDTDVLDSTKITFVPDVSADAVEAYRRDAEKSRRINGRKLISKINSALKRLDLGTFGYCEDTGEPIGIVRLSARPIATRTLEAQEKFELRERIFKDD